MRPVVGLRPGERLSEALVQEQEELLPTRHDKVLMVQHHRFDPAGFRQDLERLRGLVAARDRDAAVEQLKAMVGGY
jgi:FlaA1/EpsC-like NDP-sugar epimerase